MRDLAVHAGSSPTAAAATPPTNHVGGDQESMPVRQRTSAFDTHGEQLLCGRPFTMAAGAQAVAG